MALTYDAGTRVQRNRGLFGLASAFTCTIFLSAVLLFSVQPMFTKLILPLLGGASNVWNTAMVFFQAMLLGGYIYAHLTSKYLSLRGQIGLHCAVTAIGLAFLPLAIGDVSVPQAGMPTLWLIGLFAATVGAPFFALSANAPLLQKWFSLTDHPDADDPYFLYSASNAGSLLVLCAYPVLIEPMLGLGEQTSLWMGGYVGLLVAIAATGLLATRFGKGTASARKTDTVAYTSTETRLDVKTLLFWILLAFVPSSLMLGVTSHMTNTIASVPLLWIVPLALYLLTFVIAFARRPIVTSRTLGPVVPPVALLLAALVMWPFLPTLPTILVCLLGFFLIALYCHLRLVEARPDASKLTIFYIVMSLGGVLGGVFNALIAPLIFVETYEFPLVLALSAFILPHGIALLRRDRADWKGAGVIAALAVVLVLFMAIGLDLLFFGAFIGCVLLAYALWKLHIWRPLTVGLTLFGAFVPVMLTKDSETFVFKDRSFFSTLKIQRVETPEGTLHSFLHGDTIHNHQIREEGRYTVPAAYYANGGSFDVTLDAVRRGKGTLNVSMIGLGAGAMACYEQPGDKWTYFEIDPAVVEMARRPELFSFVADCAPDSTILIGDARQRMADIAPASQDLIMVDAFSSNSIPAHLLTREALALYRSRLKEDGIVFFHTSNRSLDVSSVVARLAEDAGLEARYIGIEFDGEETAYRTTANGLIVGAADRVAEVAADTAFWSRWVPSRHVRVWTDDYSSVLGTIRAHMLNDGHAAPIETVE
ncbi:MAG: fused MFS/spermidine synthase [Litorimonas sp.]